MVLGLGRLGGGTLTLPVVSGSFEGTRTIDDNRTYLLNLGNPIVRTYSIVNRKLRVTDALLQACDWKAVAPVVRRHRSSQAPASASNASCSETTPSRRST